jgi:hypothetical protein
MLVQLSLDFGKLSDSCVVVCVVTLPSLPVSGHLGACRSATGAKRSKDARNPYKPYVFVSLGLLWCRIVSDGFEI